MPVVIVSDRQLFRSALSECCEQRNTIVRQECAHVNEISVLEKNDLVLLHVSKSAQDILNDLQFLNSLAENLHIIVLTAQGTSNDLCDVLGDKVDAIIPDDRSVDALIGALAVVQEGYALVPQHTRMSPPRKMKITTQELQPIKPFSGDYNGKLSARENMILSRLTSGDSNKDIANDLGICETTVKVHLRTCYQKIGAKNRTQAAIWAVLHL